MSQHQKPHFGQSVDRSRPRSGFPCFSLSPSLAKCTLFWAGPKTLSGDPSHMMGRGPIFDRIWQGRGV